MEEGKTTEIWVRRWEDLCMDCLVKVFEKVGLESLILDIPFVCKSWYKASLDPLIYKVLHFEFMPVEERSRWATITLPDNSWAAQKNYSKLPPSTEFIKIAINRSCGMATEIVFPEYRGDDDRPLEKLFTVNALEYVLERCLTLKTLILPYFNFSVVMVMTTNECLLKMISNSKHLESLAILDIGCYIPHTKEILNEIHIHCQNFQSLTARGYITDEIASEIVTGFPNIKHLVLRDCSLPRDNLIRILSCCSKLELLDVTNCRGFDGDDAMILKLASHINIFMSEGSSVVINYDSSDDDDLGLDISWFRLFKTICFLGRMVVSLLEELEL